MTIVLGAAGCIAVLAAGAAALMLAQSRKAFRDIGSANRGKYKDIISRDLVRGEGSRRVRIAILGDSLPAGIGAEGVDTTPGGLIASMVAERSPGLAVEVVNRARAWSGARHLAAQIARLPDGRADAAVIIVGANDAPFPGHALKSAGYLKDCAAALIAAGTPAVCCTCPDLGVVTALPVPLRWYAGIASRMLARRQESAVVSVGGIPVSLHRAASRRFAADRGLLAADGFHPNGSGYRVSTGPVVDEIVKLLGAGEAPLPEPAAGTQ